jgi:predicted nuclease with TOPRIM domain
MALSPKQLVVTPGLSGQVAELQAENRDIRASNDRIDQLNEELRNAVQRLTDEKKSLESTRESLKDAIEDMQTSAKTGTDAVDNILRDLGRDYEVCAFRLPHEQLLCLRLLHTTQRARSKLGQLKTSFDGRSVIDDVVCLQVCHESTHH